MPSAEERFGPRPIVRGGHDVWTGFTDHRGVGVVRIEGKLRTVQRAAWEFAHGPLPPGARVNSCAKERACVRVEHLSLTHPTSASDKPAGVSQRRPRGTGSIRELRAGVWQVAVTAGSTSAGNPIRRYATVHGDRDDAETALAEFAAGIRRDLGDLRVYELVGRYLRANDSGSPSFERDCDVLDGVIEPAFGEHLAVKLTDGDVERALAPVYRAHGPEVTRCALGLTRDAYCWAHVQGWTDLDPTAGLTLRSIR